MGWAKLLNIFTHTFLLHFAQHNLSIELIFFQIIHSLACLLKKNFKTRAEKICSPEIQMSHKLNVFLSQNWAAMQVPTTKCQTNFI